MRHYHRQERRLRLIVKMTAGTLMVLRPCTTIKEVGSTPPHVTYILMSSNAEAELIYWASLVFQFSVCDVYDRTEGRYDMRLRQIYLSVACTGETLFSS